MGMMKKEFIEYEIGLESVRSGLDWLCIVYRAVLGAGHRDQNERVALGDLQ